MSAICIICAGQYSTDQLSELLLMLFKADGGLVDVCDVANKVEVIVLDIELHVVPKVDRYTALKECFVFTYQLPRTKTKTRHLF